MCILDQLISRTFGIPGLIFQAKVTKFGTNVGLNMLIITNYGFLLESLKINWRHFFRIFQLRALQIHHYRSHVSNFCRTILKCGKDIYGLKISEEFNCGGSASLNLRIIDLLMCRPLLASLDSFCQVKVTHFGDISSRFYQEIDLLTNILRFFPHYCVVSHT